MRARAITVADLPHVEGRRLPDGGYVAPVRPCLYCPRCGETYSAHPGDYWNLPREYVLTCANGHRKTRCQLVRKVTRYEAWT